MRTLLIVILFISGLLSYCRIEGSPTRIGYIASGTTCASAGHTNGCCTGGPCYVQGGNCYCMESCHLFGDCCSDIHAIQCFPTTCATSGFDRGCCDPLTSNSNCYVPGGTCYCDQFCHNYGDCCHDVESSVQCPTMRTASLEIKRVQEAKVMRAGQNKASNTALNRGAATPDQSQDLQIHQLKLQDFANEARG